MVFITRFVKNESLYNEIFTYVFKFVNTDLDYLVKLKKIKKKQLFFQMVVITRFVKKECHSNKILKLEFKFVISYIENLVLCSSSIKDERKNHPHRSMIGIISIPIVFDFDCIFYPIKNRSFTLKKNSIYRNKDQKKNFFVIF